MLLVHPLGGLLWKFVCSGDTVLTVDGRSVVWVVAVIVGACHLLHVAQVYGRAFWLTLVVLPCMTREGLGEERDVWGL